ncbi:hypothetical protein DFH94DRAFT_693414 [Russula ochroleuca]|uniref:Kinetochore protein n=1 Tax=Russula ochroleuca TaxID=152965 RepID=A0A9P5T8J7_9AGAM|nr:hypothetical protein DFH94DRAFT_693414 [Russula ochroleuca]
MDESREEIPRISIDSLQDWHRMKAKFSKAVLEQFDQTIRQSGLESERTSLLPHVQQVPIDRLFKSAPPHRILLQFIDTTFDKAKLNVRINGKKFEELKDEDDDREVEPFDEALDRETWSLYNQRLQWDLELATKRRKRPQEVSDLLENLFKIQDAALGELDRPVEDDEDRPDTSLPDDGILAETSDTFSKVAALSEGLHQTVNTQHERLRRLQDGEEEVNALKS